MSGWGWLILGLIFTLFVIVLACRDSAQYDDEYDHDDWPPIDWYGYP